MAGAGGYPNIAWKLEPTAQGASAIVSCIVLDRRSLNAAPKLAGQCLQGKIHVVEAGLAALRRDFNRIKYARIRRHFDIRHVRMPHEISMPERTECNAVLNHI